MSEYKDIMNNTYRISHTVLMSGEEREKYESEIIEELYRVFEK